MSMPSDFNDLSQMKNLWILLVRTLSSIGKQYGTHLELKTVIIFHYEEIEQNASRDLVRSIPELVTVLIIKSGALATKLYFCSVFLSLQNTSK